MVRVYGYSTEISVDQTAVLTTSLCGYIEKDGKYSSGRSLWYSTEISVDQTAVLTTSLCGYIEKDGKYSKVVRVYGTALRSVLIRLLYLPPLSMAT